MRHVDFGPVGVALNVSQDDAHLAEATELERPGYSALWLPGGELDSLGRISDLVAATTTARVAPAIIPPDVYAADAVAATYARLEDTHPRLVDALVSWGDESAIATRVQEHPNAGADHVILGVLADDDQPGPTEVARQLAHRLTPGSA